MYLDDGWECYDFDACKKMSLSLQNDLANAGVLVHKDKSQWEAVLDWLGFTWNLRDGYIDIPTYKLDIIRLKVHKMKNKVSSSARELAPVVGSITCISL